MISVGLFILVLLNFFGNARTVSKDNCEGCVYKEECPLFGNMTKQDQQKWMESFPCSKPPGEERSKLFGFAPVAKGDYICCPPPNVWGIEGQETSTQNVRVNYRNQDTHSNVNKNYYSPSQDDIDTRNNFDKTVMKYPDEGYFESNSGYPEDSYSQSRRPTNRNLRPQINARQNQYPTNQNPYFMKNPNIDNNLRRPGNTNINNNNFGRPGNANFDNNNSNFGRSRNRNSDQLAGRNGQCSGLTSFIPEPESGCCGRDVTGGDRITGVQNYAPQTSNAGRNNWDMPADLPFNFNPFNWPSWFPRARGFSDQPMRIKRAVKNVNVNVTVDTRIAGGRETELEQFPWTVLLQTTFNYGNKESTFNCGGSIISSRYVLTAAHCVNEEDATISRVEINLAEFDKRTFPRDCVNTLSEGRKCIENIVMYAERVISHPDYDDQKLQNDIALIRLKGHAPYTDYIRPICLPQIDIDNPEFSNLKLSVAGWGRNGQYNSEVKQSTVVNLVPQSECKRSYPFLTRRHLCAAGYTGEDTCKGDSGGPLMMVYEGKYFVSGVVSGKRADSPCGTSVPSLYTNVYQYRDRIMDNIRN